jgi:hypothetical protein
VENQRGLGVSLEVNIWTGVACLIWVAVSLSWSLLQQKDAIPCLEECIREAVPEAKWFSS